MSSFTYETNSTASPLETYEWDNVWWECATTTGVPRVLYIGDSISCGTRRAATAAAQSKIFFDGFGTSKALDNPYFTEALRLFGKQQGERTAVIFNNGLHGWHLDDTEQYPYYYEKTVKFLLEEYKATPVFLVLTTSVADLGREERVRSRNEAVRSIAKKYGLPIIDLYSVSVEFSELRTGDGVHFSSAGYQKFAERIVCDINNMLEIIKE